MFMIKIFNDNHLQYKCFKKQQKQLSLKSLKMRKHYYKYLSQLTDIMSNFLMIHVK